VRLVAHRTGGKPADLLFSSAKGEAGFRTACREPSKARQLAGWPGHAKNAKEARISQWITGGRRLLLSFASFAEK
jgi:hypothetical protein